jgi:hypothetical protein
MINNIRKIIVRVAVMSVMLAILSYIFWPQAKISDTVPDTIPEVTSTLAIVIVADPPCLVFYQKDKDIPVFDQTACASTYIDKYKAGYYSTLNVECRSSSDGQAVNRNDISGKRAKSLQFALLEKGIAFKDIKVKSLGDTSPYPGIDPDSADGKILNRSCEITGTIKQ